MKIKLIVPCLVAALIVCCIPLLNTSAAVDEIVTINGIEYKQTFEDEFEGTKLDKTKWNLCPEWGRQGNYCYWNDNMTSLDGEGHLVLTADYDGTGILRCGAIRSRELFYQKYGYFEISCKLQSVGGFWSAFWLMPDNIDTGIDGGSDGTEMDIFEAFSVKNQSINHAVHFDGYGSRHKSKGASVHSEVYDGKYHTFAMDWSPDAYTFYIDGKQSYQITSEQVDIAKVENYLKISLESGSWTGLPDENDLPDGLTVDYVKVYQRVAAPTTTAEPTTVPTTTTVPATTVEPTTKAILYGDANSDNVVNARDLLIIKQYYADWKVDIDLAAADVNVDSGVDGKDILLLRQYFADYPVVLGKK